MDKLQKGNVVIEWVELGEGWCGDYDPNDPDDVEMLRFDAYIAGHEWEDGYPTYSYCTSFPVSSSPEVREAGLKYLMEHLYEPMSKGERCRHLAEEMSWINPSYVEA